MALDPARLAGLRVTVVGAAREGTALVRYLAARGARVTLSDGKPAAALAGALEAIAGLDVRLALGENPPDLLDVDVLFASPGVPPTAPIIRQARAQGLPISSEPRLFTQLCAAPVVGITGSSGKTTTTSLVGRILAADGRATWVGGNIGQPLLERMLEDERPDVAVMELSSFQLEFFDPAYQGPEVELRRTAASRAISLAGWSPHVAAITNICLLPYRWAYIRPYLLY
jgi:UDP-N-acetylmuramoylalanine--D-glutamate ligase